MTRSLTVLALALALTIPLFAQEAPPTDAIPVPAGAVVNTEMDVDRDQLQSQLPIILQLRVPLGTNVKMDPDQLRAALGSLKRVQFAEMSLKGKYAATDLLSFFEKNVEGRRVLWSIEGKPGAGMLLVALPGGGYFAALTKATISKDGRITAGTIRAARFTGFLDMANAVKLAVPILKDMGVLKMPSAAKTGSK